jgi:hypothetical protein
MLAASIAASMVETSVAVWGMKGILSEIRIQGQDAGLGFVAWFQERDMPHIPAP